MVESGGDKTLEDIKRYVREGQKPQTTWFQICSALMGLYVIIVSFLFLELWNTNKLQDKEIVTIERGQAVTENRVSQLERVVYKQ